MIAFEEFHFVFLKRDFSSFDTGYYESSLIEINLHQTGLWQYFVAYHKNYLSKCISGKGEGGKRGIKSNDNFTSFFVPFVSLFFL